MTSAMTQRARRVARGSRGRRDKHNVACRHQHINDEQENSEMPWYILIRHGTAYVP